MLTLSLAAADRSIGNSSPIYKMPSMSTYSKTSKASQQHKEDHKPETNNIIIDPSTSFIRILTDPKSTLGKSIPNVMFDISETAPAPSRDFCQLVIVKPNLKSNVELSSALLEPRVTYRCWKISSRNHGQSRPHETSQTISEYLQDDKTQNEVGRVFGDETREHVLRLCRGQLCFLRYLPTNLQVRVLAQLDLLDLRRLALVSRHFYMLCNSDELWRYMFETQRRKGQRSTADMDDLDDVAAEQAPGGWRKLFFMGPLQLQASLARVAKRKRNGQLTDRSQRTADGSVPGLELGTGASDERSGSGRDRYPYPGASSDLHLEIESVAGSTVNANGSAPPANSSFFVTRAVDLRSQLPPIAVDLPELVHGLRPNPPPREFSISDVIPRPQPPATPAADEDNDPQAAEKTERIRRWLLETQSATSQQ